MEPTKTTLQLASEFAAISVPLAIDNAIVLSRPVLNNILFSVIDNEELAANAFISQYEHILLVGLYGCMHILQPLYVRAIHDKCLAKKKVREIYHSSMLFALLLSLPIMLIFSISGHVLGIIGVRDDLSNMTAEFLQTYLWSIPGILLVNCQFQFFLANKKATWLILLALLRVSLNFGLGCLLTLYFGMGLKGIAVAQVIQPYLAFIISIVFLAYSRLANSYSLLSSISISKVNVLGYYFKKATPLFLQRSSVAGLGMITAYFISKIGDQTLAAYQISSAFSSWLTFPLISTPPAITVLVAKYMKENKKQLAKKAVYLGAAVNLLIGFFGMLIMTLGYKPIANIYFIQNETMDSKLFLAFSLNGLHLPFKGIANIFTAALIGLEETLKPFFCSLFSIWCIGIGLTYISQTLNLALTGILLPISIASLSTALLTFYVWQQKHNHYRTPIERGNNEQLEKQRLFTCLIRKNSSSTPNNYNLC